LIIDSGLWSNLSVKYLAVDVGKKRVGLAVSDEEGIVTRPLLTINVTEKLVSEIGKAVLAEGPGEIVVGLPRHMSGDEGQEANNIRELGKILHHEFGLPVNFQDESLTSVEAEKRLRERGFNYKKVKEMVDAEAAAIILEDYLAGKK
jgi:putative holliday junction resolvase